MFLLRSEYRYAVPISCYSYYVSYAIGSTCVDLISMVSVSHFSVGF